MIKSPRHTTSYSPVENMTLDLNFCGSFVFLCLAFPMFSCLFIAALWSPAGKGLTSWLSLVMFIVFYPCTVP